MPRKGGVPENLKPFKKGKPGGPGRPKGKTMATMLTEMLARKLQGEDPMTGELRNMTAQERLALSLFEQALKGNVRAATEIIDRTDGKAVQKIESQQINIDYKDLEKMSDEELKELDEKLKNGK